MSSRILPLYEDVFHLLQNSCLKKTNYSNPSGFKIIKHPNSASDVFRVYFTALASNYQQLPYQILFADFPTGQNVSLDASDWIQLFEEKNLSQTKESSSLAADLLKERMRSMKSGVTQFLVDKSGILLFIANGSVYCSHDNFDRAIIPKYIETGCSGLVQLSISGSSSSLVAGVSGSNVFVGSLESVSPWKNVTCYSNTTEGVFAGLPAFAIQEEFHRYTGYWWCPKHTTMSDSKTRHMILFEHTDETTVDEVCLFCQGAGSMSDFEKHRYPKPGSKNANSELRMTQFSYDSTSHEIEDTSILMPCLSTQVKQIFSGYEYITRAGWTKDGTYVWMQMMDRLQTTATVFLLPAACFLSPNIHEIDDLSKVSCQHPVIKILEESAADDAWVEAHNFWTFLDSGTSSSVEFLTCSQVICGAERQKSSQMGFMDLYHVRRDWSNIPNENGLIDASKSGFIRALTPSNFDLTAIHVNESSKTVYFEANVLHPLCRSICSVSYADNSYGDMRILNTTALDPNQIDLQNQKTLVWDSFAACDPDSNVFLRMSSDPSTVIALELCRVQPSGSVESLGFLREPESYDKIQATNLKPIYPPKYLEIDMPDCNPIYLKEQKMYGQLYTPTNSQFANKDGSFPTIHFVYGGPGVQLVNSAFNSRLFLKAQILCHFGFAVFICDCLGSDGRGLSWSKQLKYKMGQIEVQNHVHALKEAARMTGLIDLQRTGIYGHSYGGYLTLMAACQAPDIYKGFVAAAPVVDWRLYDTAYTERYMGLPQDQKTAYDNGCVLTYAKNIPSDRCRLLIIQGGKDENVHFLHTSNLLSLLNKLGKPYSFGFYPTSRHGITERDQYDASMICFLMDLLM